MKSEDEKLSGVKFFSTIEEAEDGSGDGILTFPPEVLEAVGWAEGDVLNLHVDDFGCLIISKKS